MASGGFLRVGGGCEKESPSHGFAVPAPFRQGGEGTGEADCHSQCAHWLRNDRLFCKECGGWWAVAHMGATLRRLMVKKTGGVEPRPYGCLGDFAVVVSGSGRCRG